MDAVFDEKYYHASDDASADLEKIKILIINSSMMI